MYKQLQIQDGARESFPCWNTTQNAAADTQGARCEGVREELTHIIKL